MDKKASTEKRLFTLVFLLFLLGYSISNFIMNRETVLEAVHEFDIHEPAESVAALDSGMTEEVLGQYQFVELYGQIQKLLGKKEVNGFDVVKDKNGYLHNGNFWVGFWDDTKELGIRARRMKDAVEAQGSRFGFVIMPMKTPKEGSEYWGIPYNDYNGQAESLKNWLDYYSVEYLDLGEVIKQSGLSYEETFFKTDHHWTPRAAFYGFCQVVEWMNRSWDAGLDPEGRHRDIAEYEIKVLEGLMLGSQGRDTGYVYAEGMEDYEVLIPKEKGDYLWQFGNRKEELDEKRGVFEETMLDLHVKGNIYDALATRTYLNDINEFDHLENLDSPEGKKLLLLRDSYTSPLASFLIQTCGEIDLMWTQRYESGEIETYLEENQYDYVLLMLYPENLSEINFPFYESELKE